MTKTKQTRGINQAYMLINQAHTLYQSLKKRLYMDELFEQKISKYLVLFYLLLFNYY